MTFPIDIRFQGLERSDALVAEIAAAAAKLADVHDRIERCEVVVEKPHQGRPRFHVRVRLHVPGPDIIVDRDTDADDGHDDAYLAARDALRAVRGRLEAHVRRQRDDVRRRAPER